MSYTDALIGSTTIDLENRLHGKLRVQIMNALQLNKDMIVKKKVKEEKKERPNKLFISRY